MAFLSLFEPLLKNLVQSTPVPLNPYFKIYSCLFEPLLKNLVQSTSVSLNPYLKKSSSIYYSCMTQWGLITNVIVGSNVHTWFGNLLCSKFQPKSNKGMMRKKYLKFCFLVMPCVTTWTMIHECLAAHARLPLELEHIDNGTETFLYAMHCSRSRLE
jgi:hypothetical protein